MRTVGCQIMCRCGGTVDRLCDDCIIYVITENLTIIFRGVCNQCGENVSVEKDIISLLALAPDDNKTVN